MKWTKKNVVNFIARWIALVLLAHTLEGCFLPIGPVWANRFDLEVSTMNQEFREAFFLELRPPKYWSVDRSTLENGTTITSQGAVPYQGVRFDNRDVCGMENDACASYVFGTELSSDPALRFRIERWFTNFCIDQPVAFTKPRAFDHPINVMQSVQDRNRRFGLLRDYMGCNSAAKRPIDIHIYVIRDADLGFGGSDTAARRRFLSRIAEKKILKLNY
jgi:hypothetical protein